MKNANTKRNSMVISNLSCGNAQYIQSCLLEEGYDTTPHTTSSSAPSTLQLLAVIPLYTLPPLSFDNPSIQVLKRALPKPPIQRGSAVKSIRSGALVQKLILLWGPDHFGRHVPKELFRVCLRRKSNHSELGQCVGLWFMTVISGVYRGI